MTQKAVLVVLLLPLFLASTVRAVTECSCPAGCPVCEPLQVGMDASIAENILEYGESTNVSISVRNSEPNITSLECNYNVQGQSGTAQNVANDGQWHQMGLAQVVAPQAIAEHQVSVSIPVEVNCSAQLANQSGIAWCGSSCSSFTLAYVYPSSQTIAEYKQEQLDAINKLSLARTALTAAESMITKAESVNAQSPYLNQSKEKSETAAGILTTASFMYDQTAFNQSITYSESAISYAHDAETLAYLAYGAASPSTAYSYVMRLIDEAQRQGGRMSENIARIADTMALAGTSGVGIGGPFKGALENERKSLEEADRLLEEAKLRLREGNYTGAAESALSAETLIEKAREVIDSLFQSIKKAFVNAIAKTHSSLLSEIEAVSARLNAASLQKGVNLEEIKIGRTDIGYAKHRTTKASAIIGKAANAQNLPELLESSSDALLEIRSAHGYVQDAKLHAYLSMLGKYMAVAVVSGGAALLAALVWWIEKRKDARVETAGLAARKSVTEPVRRGKPRRVLGKRRRKKTGRLRLQKPATGKSLPGRRRKKPSRANRTPRKSAKAGKQRSSKKEPRKGAGRGKTGTKRKQPKKRK